MGWSDGTFYADHCSPLLHRDHGCMTEMIRVLQEKGLWVRLVRVEVQEITPAPAET